LTFTIRLVLNWAIGQPLTFGSTPHEALPYMDQARGWSEATGRQENMLERMVTTIGEDSKRESEY